MTTTVLERPINKKVIEELDLPTEWLGYDVEMRIINEHKKKNEIKLDIENLEKRIKKLKHKIPVYQLQSNPNGSGFVIPKDSPEEVLDLMKYDY
jgi:hypothetical protein